MVQPAVTASRGRGGHGVQHEQRLALGAERDGIAVVEREPQPDDIAPEAQRPVTVRDIEMNRAERRQLGRHVCGPGDGFGVGSGRHSGRSYAGDGRNRSLRSRA